MRTNKARGSLIVFLAGLLPVLAVVAAYLVNIQQTDVASCIPLWSGCVSISRAVRSGPGLVLFKTLVLPAAILLAVGWIYVSKWVRDCRLATDKLIRIVRWFGLIGAAFMALYVINLGLDGQVYWFMRRFGVSLFFGLMTINHLLLVHILWPARPRLSLVALRSTSWLVVIVCLEWFAGIVMTGKRLLVSNPDMMDRMENIVEWWFALLLMGATMLLGRLISGNHPADV